MKRLRAIRLILLTALFVGVGLWLGNTLGQRRAHITESGRTPPATTPPTAPATPSAELQALARSPEALLNEMFARLRAGDFKPEDLQRFRLAVLSAPREQAIAALVQFLATGQDAVTGETFLLGEDGTLAGAPTYRVLLLDLLGRLCRETGTGEAVAVARQVLQKKNNAEEWAVALRNVGWGAPKDIAFLTEKTRELIRHEPWRQQPSAGYREAFDLIVFTRDVAMIPDLSSMLTGDDESLRSSAAVALDRLAEMAPLDAMNFLNQNRNELVEKPFLRADYFSKADLSQPAQRQAIEFYLARPDVEVKEKVKMLSVMASPGSFVSDTLLTEPPPEEFPPERTAALQRSVQEWLQTERFPNLNNALMQLQDRLASP